MYGMCLKPNNTMNKKHEKQEKKTTLNKTKNEIWILPPNKQTNTQNKHNQTHIIPFLTCLRNPIKHTYRDPTHFHTYPKTTSQVKPKRKEMSCKRRKWKVEKKRRGEEKRGVQT